jgi:hypothetical protein
MTNIKEITPDDEHFEHAITSSKTKPLVNYKDLSRRILDGEVGQILELEVRDRGLYSNIKRALKKRKIIFGVDYDLAYRTIEGKKFIFVTVKG